MLEEYKEGQPVVYRILNNIILNKRYNHAYLFFPNDYLYANEMILAFVKILICPNHYTNKDKCHNCNTCFLIDNHSYPELKIIKPDGLWIKKEQLLGLQKQFSYKAIQGNKKVYIIYEAEKMNSSAANCMLKFLEEPEDDIIAILISNNIHQLLPTILSRCQIITFKQNKIEDYMEMFNDIKNKTLLKLGLLCFPKDDTFKDFISDEKNEIKITSVINFILKYESDRLDVILNIKKLWHDQFKEKNDFVLAFNIMIFFYKDVINYLSLKKVEIFNEYLDDIKKVASQNNINDIIDKIKKLMKIKEMIKNNVNLNLIIDKLILSMEGCATL